MKIDIHTHTKKCKSGDAPSREISPDDFCKTVLATEVKIIAITNHNAFDLGQFSAIQSLLSNDVQVWPGIEIDVVESGSRGHLLVIVSPTKAKEFSETIDAFTIGFTPDSFTASIAGVLAKFDSYGPLYVAHYRQKKPDLSDTAIEALLAGTENPSRVIKEVTNSISAGIYISHGHASIYGSDVHDWSEYEEHSHELPELRLPVDSFEHFCLLLEKDQNTINTLLDKKTADDLVISPFEDGSTLEIRAFSDINVIFGSKGTGKSCILKAIAKHYSDKGVDANVFEHASDRLDEEFDVKGKLLTIDLKDYNIEYCTNEIETLRNAIETAITSLGNYVAYYRVKSSNRNAQKIRLKEMAVEDISTPKREFLDFNKSAETTRAFLQFLSTNTSIAEVLTRDEREQVIQIISQLLERLEGQKSVRFSGWREISFLNQAIEVFRREVGRKTGTPARPTTTGFRDYALNRVRIEINASRILKSVDSKIPMLKVPVGSLGPDKGELEYCTEFMFQSGNVADSSFTVLSKVNKTPQKEFIKCIRRIVDHAYSDDLFQFTALLNKIEGAEDIKSVYEQLQFRRYFAVGGVPYSPSSGEASMVMLQRELGVDKDVYILDEPEKSLGNEYINDVIVPMINERARANKKIFISTHDANIAVRTLPYSSIYRCHGKEGYSTYVGNPFSNNLKNLDRDDQLDWKKVSMRTLEGGEEAFGERGKIYGNS